MSGPVTRLAAYFRNQLALSALDMTRLAAGARASGLRWADIARACDPGGLGPGYAGDFSWRMFRDIQHAAGTVAGNETRLVPFTWPCADCGRKVSDIAPDGRPVHAEAGHGSGCTRLARDQAADDRERQVRVPALIAGSEPACGTLQRHRLAERFTDWCPRCGWHGYFEEHAATIDGDMAWLICDNCWADLSPDVHVTVTFYTCTAVPHDPGHGQPFGVIRQRVRTGSGVPGPGQVLTWEPYWHWTPILAEEARGGADCDLRQVSQATAQGVVRSLIGRHWPGEALGLPWIANAYPASGRP